MTTLQLRKSHSSNDIGREARVGIWLQIIAVEILISILSEVRKSFFDVLGWAFEGNHADSFADCDMRSLEQLFVMDTS